MIKINSFRFQKTQAALLSKKGDGVKSFKDLQFSAETLSLPEQQHTSPLSALAPLNELLQLQNIGRTPNDHIRTEEDGNKILHELDKLRLNLLTGMLSASEMRHLSDLVNQNLSPAHDPQLNLIIEEIEQRLAIELTKLEMLQT